MSEQLALSLAFTRHTKLEEQFLDWLATQDGQLVLREARSRSLRLLARGFRHYSIDAVWQSIRFDRSIEVGPDEDGWKLNNNHRAYMARELMATTAELRGFFELRELTSE